MIAVFSRRLASDATLLADDHRRGRVDGRLSVIDRGQIRKRKKSANARKAFQKVS
jgi:hypothetical protein